jgi:GNAT superfamily N-acetyltransferase
MGNQSCLGAGIRPARIKEAAALSDLCVRSKAVWGYDDSFMALARGVLQVGVKQIAAGDVWVATMADGSLAGVVALASGEQPGTLDLDKLFVEPRHIRAGFGRALLDHATREAKRRGATRLTILADPYVCRAVLRAQWRAPDRGGAVRCNPGTDGAVLRDDARLA